MSKLLRICCSGVADVPPPTELEKLAVVGVLLQFPPNFRDAKRSLIDSLALQLPSHTVFDSGGPDGKEWVTILKVIDEKVVLDHLAVFLEAIHDFSTTANDLACHLAKTHGISPADLFARRGDIQRKGGNRLANWRYAFHGCECAFTNRKTGQVVDVKICFRDQFGAMDPYFLSRFIRTTPAHEAAARLLRDDFHDARRMLDILKRHGFLRVHETPSEELRDHIFRGLILNTPPDVQKER